MRVFVGILLIVLSSLALIAIVFIPLMPGMTDNPTMLNFVASLVCDTGERASMEIVVTEDDEGTGYTPNVTCIGREGEQTDATGKLFLIAGGVFTIPFLIGLFMLIARPRRRASETIQIGQDFFDIGQNARTGVVSSSSFSTSSSSPNVVTRDGVFKMGGIEVRVANLNPEQADMLDGLSKDFFETGNMGNVSGVSSSTSGNLADKLKEIQDALTSGLISQQEYDRLRQEILDKLV